MQWVLSRPLYRFSRFDLKHVSKAQRAQALRIQIRQWSPYVNTGQYVVWGEEHALVWAWDADRLANEIAAQNLKLASTAVIPETLLHPPLASGLRLVTCLDGVEGQLWLENRVIHCRWWAEPPTPADWRSFLRDGGIAPDQSEEIPAVQALNWLKQPWAKTGDLGRDAGQSLPHETWLVRAVVLLFTVFTVWYAIEMIKTKRAVSELKAQLAVATQSAQPLLAARRSALDSLARIEALQGVNPNPAQLALLAEVANNLPKDGTYLNEWDYQNGKLKIAIVSSNKLSSSFLVKKLQETGWFRNVQATPSNDPTALILTMETLPQRDIMLLPKAATSQAEAGKMGNAGEPAKLIPKS